jgi:nucleotide-binding universal stress UspA family protein
MYTEVVVGIDGTDAGRDALVLALTVASGSMQLILAHVRVLEAPARGGSSAAFAAQTREDSIQLLSAERERAGAPAEILSVLASSVGSGLHDVAESRGAGLLVVGSCHRSAVGRVLTGDDTRAVLHRAPCAVAVAPRQYRDRVKPLEVIGVAYDGSAHGKVALAHARALAQETGARVVARHVAQLKVYGAGIFAAPVPDVEEAAACAAQKLGDLGDVELSVCVGASGEELAVFSESVDVLICGSRHNGIVKRVALGSTSDYLGRHCACPLIITTAAVQEPGTSAKLDRLATT